MVGKQFIVLKWYMEWRADNYLRCEDSKEIVFDFYHSSFIYKLECFHEGEDDRIRYHYFETDLSKDSGIDHLQYLIWKETDITCLLLEDYPPLKPNLKSIKL